MTKLQKSALACGANPLLAGIGVYIAWRITRADILMIAGLWIIAIGLVAFLAGLAFLAANHLRSTDKASGDLRTSARILALLLLNFPAATLCVWSAQEVHSRYTVTVINDSDTPISDFEITGAGISRKFAALAPGKTVSDYFHPTTDGSLNFTAKHDGRPLGGCIEGYVTGGSGGEATIRIHAGDAWEKTR